MTHTHRISPWIFPGAVAGLYAVLWVSAPDRIPAALTAVRQIGFQVVPPLAGALVMMFLLNRYVSPDHATRLMGKGAGFRGMALSSLAGIISMGPVFAWFPFLGTVKRKQIPEVYLANFIASRAVKPVLLPVLIAYFGWRFALTFTIMCLAAAWAVSFIVFLSSRREGP